MGTVISMVAERRGVDVVALPEGVAGAVERLAHALTYETVSFDDGRGPDAEALRGFHDFLRASYPDVHRALTREVVNGLSLLYTWPGTDSTAKPIVLLAHQDVVPVERGTEDRWTHGAFSGAVADGHVWGRGALDDKVSLLGILEAVESLVAVGFRPRRTVYLAFGHDEEVGGEDGAAEIAALLRSRGVRLEYTLDEGMAIGHGLIPGVTDPVAMVGIAEKGRVTLELTVAGAGGHASIPPASTAAGILARAIHRLEQHPMRASLVAPVRRLFEAVSPAMPLGHRLAFANLWLFEPLIVRHLARSPRTNALVRTTAAVTRLEAGAKDNVLPVTAKAAVNARILPGDSVAGVTEHVRRVVDDSRVAIRVLRAMEPSPVSGAGASSFGAVADAIRRVFPEARVAPGLVVAGTDTRHYVSLADAAYRFVPLRLAPEDLSRVHGVDERIAVDNYAEIVRFYRELLQGR